MNIHAKPLALIIFVVFFGGIGLSSLLGWWQTESSKVPAAYSAGEFAGQANPADIRGSYTFGDIAASFDVTPEMLAKAFQVTQEDPAAFAVKDLETLYGDSEYAIDVNSVRLFVAFRLGLPFDTAGQDFYLPRPAADILLAEAPLSAEQAAYVTAHAVDVEPGSSPDEVADPAEEAGSAPETGATQPATEAGTSSIDYTVKGKTTFGELIQWGVPQPAIEALIGGPLPDPATKIKDYATANNLDFETLKTQLQAEVDKIKP
jgi:hypothetical protein